MTVEAAPVRPAVSLNPRVAAASVIAGRSLDRTKGDLMTPDALGAASASAFAEDLR